MRSSGFVLGLVLAVLVVGALAVVGSYTFLPPILENSLAKDIRSQLDLEKKPEVELASNSPFRLLAGEFSSGRVTLEEPEFAGIRPKRVTVRLGAFDINVLESIEHGRFKPDGKLSGRLRVEVSQSEVRRIIQEGAGDVPIIGVKLEKDRMLVGSKVLAFGIRVPVSVEGRLSIEGGKLVFDPERVSALGITIPKDLSRNLLSGGFGYPLGELPYGTKITGVKVEKGEIVFSGEIQRLVAG